MDATSELSGPENPQHEMPSKKFRVISEISATCQLVMYEVVCKSVPCGAKAKNHTSIYIFLDFRFDVENNNNIMFRVFDGHGSSSSSYVDWHHFRGWHHWYVFCVAKKRRTQSIFLVVQNSTYE